MQQIDNPMANFDHSDDIQCKPLPYKCSMCKEECNSITHFLTGDDVCDDCKSEYLRLNCGEFISEYIQNNKQQYYKSWWFNNLRESEQLEIIYRAHKSKEAFELSQNIPNLIADKVEFCLEQDNFLEYVEMCLT